LILDTNALSALADGNSAIELILNSADRLAVPVIVLGEFRYGIQQSRHRVQYEEWLLQALTRLQTVVVDEETADQYAQIRQHLKRIGRPIPSNDVWIASLARQHRMPILSRDAHFDWVTGLKRIVW
jgi:tRNA(fMet)-specific endonuclease VapC